MMIVSESQFHVNLPWGQCLFSIVSLKCLKCESFQPGEGPSLVGAGGLLCNCETDWSSSALNWCSVGWLSQKLHCHYSYWPQLHTCRFWWFICTQMLPVLFRWTVRRPRHTAWWWRPRASWATTGSPCGGSCRTSPWCPKAPWSTKFTWTSSAT